MPRILGIDEAGRGALLGPLVVAGVAIERGEEGRLWEMGARDSKTLPRAQRKKVLRTLWQGGLRGWAVVVPPLRIDQENLTRLEYAAMVELLRKTGAEEVVVDPPVGPLALARFLRDLSGEAGLPRERVHGFPHADAQHPVVAAASLLAKVVRDGYVVALRREYGDFGWGYPGERKVQEFLRGWLEKHGELPPVCRKRWRSVQTLFALKLQEGL